MLNFTPYFLTFSVFALTACSGLRQGPIGPPGVDEVEKLSLGGDAQTIFIRGRDRANPVLLFLHGGPGLPEMPFSHVNAALERDFTVVYWDQLGAGRSYNPDIPPKKLTVKRFVADTETLSRYLAKKFGKDKIYLAGYSWGSLIGALAASRSPELYFAYIGISQFVNLPRSEALLHQHDLQQAKKQGAKKALATLKQIGPPPYQNPKEGNRVNRIEEDLQPPIPHKMTQLRYLWLGLQSRYYSLGDDLNVVRGMGFSYQALYDEIWSFDLSRAVSEIDVPVYFFRGQYDTVLSPTLGEQYFERLKAPKGKHLETFEKSDHNLHLEESDRFRRALVRIRDETQD